MAWELDDRHFEVARRAVERHALRTALVPAPALGPDIWLKLETEQHTGSFKVRGALARLAALSGAERSAGVVTASAGNHGLGVAFAARVMGVEARVFVPRDTPLIKREGIAGHGARVEVMAEPGYDQAEAKARAAAAKTGEVFVSPYDDPYVAAGNGGTIAEEILEQLGALDSIVMPVGGGGLLAGVAAEVKRSGRSVRLVGVQSEASPAMTRSLEEGRAHETWEPAPTFAEGLEGGVAAGSVERAKAAGVAMHLVTEAAIADAMRFAHSQLGLRVEGSAAVPIAWALGEGHREPARTAGGARVLIITGRNVDERVWAAVLAGESDPLAARAAPQP